jgi:transcriptional regulator with XRE-family HTH domain
MIHAMSPIQLRLAHWRDKRGLTQVQLAEAAKVSVSMVSKIESGQRRNVSLDTIEKLADALSISVHQLIEQTPRK